MSYVITVKSMQYWLLLITLFYRCWGKWQTLLFFKGHLPSSMLQIPHGKTSVYSEFPVYVLFSHCLVILPKCRWATVTVDIKCSGCKCTMLRMYQPSCIHWSRSRWAVYRCPTLHRLMYFSMGRPRRDMLMLAKTLFLRCYLHLCWKLLIWI